MDRRIRKTRAQLVMAMVQCAEKTDWEDVGIQQICDAADVARSTFYLHFKNKAELLDHAFDMLADEIRKLPKTRSLDEDCKIGVLPVLFEFMTSRNHNFLFRRRGASAAAWTVGFRLKGTIADMIAEEFAHSRHHANTQPSTVSFISAGVYAALEEWHETGGKKNAGAVVSQLDVLVSKLLPEG